MKAYIDYIGRLHIEAETEIESFALRAWEGINTVNDDIITDNILLNFQSGEYFQELKYTEAKKQAMEDEKSTDPDF